VRSAAPTTNGSPSASLPTALPATVEPGPIEPRVEVRLEVPGEPDWMASGAGSVWVKTADGYVQRIDPATNQVVVVAVDPEHGAVPTRVDGLTNARQISANGVEDLTAAEQSGGEVIVAYGSVWATAYDDNVLYRIRPD
jgi:hypothetical protein